MNKPPVQGLWIGEKLSQIELACMQSYVRQGHEFHLYCYHSFEQIPHGVQLRDANEIISEKDIFTYRKGPGKGSYAAFANLFRYKLLHERGGWWTDMDFICLKPLPNLNSRFLAAEWKEKPTRLSGAIRTRLSRLEKRGIPFNSILKPLINKSKPSNALMFAPKGDPMFQLAFELAHTADPNSLVWGQYGPDLMNRLLYDDGFISDTTIGSPVNFMPIGGYQIADIFESSNRFPLRQAITVHLYNEHWRRLGKAKDSTFPKDTLISRLLLNQ